MFAWWISYEEKTGEVALMSRDSGFRVVNRVVASNRTIHDKEEFRLYEYSYIWIRFITKGKN